MTGHGKGSPSAAGRGPAGNAIMDKIERQGKIAQRGVLFVVLSLAAVFIMAALTGCGAAPASDSDSDSDGRLQIVTTIFPQYDFARAVAGGQADVTMLLKPGEEIHSYEPTPRDILAIQECDLFIYVGGENDVWVERILDGMGEDRPRTLRLVDLVDTVDEEIVEGMMPERETHADEDEESADEHVPGGDASGETHEEPDEHVWTSPRNAAVITEKIAESMSALDPDNAEIYGRNAADYEAQILALDEEFRAVRQKAKRDTIVFGDRFPIRYFALEYGLRYYAAFPGCSAESEPSAATLAFLIDKVREDKIPVVFSIEFSSGNIARAICESTGAVQRTFHTCHNVTRDEFESGATYVSLMRGNLEAVREALCGDMPLPQEE